jgi:hypothetical protein
MLCLKNTIGAWVMIPEPEMSVILERSLLNNYLRRLGIKRYIPLTDEAGN